jgi:hypothetical protein
MMNCILMSQFNGYSEQVTIATFRQATIVYIQGIPTYESLEIFIFRVSLLSLVGTASALYALSAKSRIPFSPGSDFILNG